MGSLSTGVKFRECVLACLLLLPFMFINVRDSQHWGDDFAVYIHQAINISEGKNFSETSYLYVPAFSSLAPSAPVGFSVLLSPVYKFFGFNMLAFSFFMSFLFVLWALVSFIFFRKNFSASTSLIMLLVAFFPNFMFWLKLLITSDVPFSILFLVIAALPVFAKAKSKWLYIFCGLLTALAASTRYVGFIIVPSLWLFAIYVAVTTWQKNRDKNFMVEIIRNTFIYTTVFGLTYLLINNFLFKTEQNNIGNTINILEPSKLAATFVFNAKYYALNYAALFKSTDPDLKNISSVFSKLMLAFTLIGFLLKLFRKAALAEFIVVCYTVFIFLFPVISDYRYLVPVHPFYIFYIFYALHFFFKKLGRKSLAALQVPFIALVLFLFKDHLQYLATHSKEILPGPYEQVTQETFRYIKQNINSDALIVFNKPRALALYTGKKTTMQNWELGPEENYAHLHCMKAKYYLHSWMVNDYNYKELIAYKQTSFKEVYKNWQFTLYEDTTVTTAVKNP
jgi:hypothetical protein